MIKCPKCNVQIEEGTRFCSKCGCNIEKEYLIEPVCPKCERQYPDGTRFCNVDGSLLTTKDKLIPKCIKCGKIYPKGVKYCPDDGGEVVPEAFRTFGFDFNSSAFDIGKKVDVEGFNRLISEGYEVKIRDYFNQGWELFKANMGMFIGFSLVYLLIHILLNMIPFVGPLVGWVISTPLAAGYYFAAFALLNKEQIEFNIFFKGLSMLMALFLAGLLTSIFTTVGYILLILPGVYLTVAYLFTTPLIVDKKMEFWQAMETSRRLITKQWFSLFLLFAAIALLNVLGAIALLVGLLFTVPLTFCIFACAYRDITRSA
ncbi:MAG: zinc ribbon domain-containing protein [Thermodesulfovibrionales bacterium]|nr:zinc ribbon domain-containing protein [Thermodesulfovibrionales bacterium]